jgi:ankyrin repeat protein
VAKLLLEEGGNMESKPSNGQTLLWWAVEKKHEALVQLPLEKGANVESRESRESRSTYGHMPLSWAVFDWNVALVKLLLERAPKNFYIEKG